MVRALFPELGKVREPALDPLNSNPLESVARPKARGATYMRNELERLQKDYQLILICRKILDEYIDIAERAVEQACMYMDDGIKSLDKCSKPMNLEVIKELFDPKDFKASRDKAINRLGINIHHTAAVLINTREIELVRLRRMMKNAIAEWKKVDLEQVASKVDNLDNGMLLQVRAYLTHRNADHFTLLKEYAVIVDSALNTTEADWAKIAEDSDGSIDRDVLLGDLIFAFRPSDPENNSPFRNAIDDIHSAGLVIATREWAKVRENLSNSLSEDQRTFDKVQREKDIGRVKSTGGVPEFSSFTTNIVLLLGLSVPPGSRKRAHSDS